jgi:hypothetical protein
VDLLNINAIQWRNRQKPTPDKALCVFLRRLASPNDLNSCADLFGRSTGWISACFNDVAEHVATSFEDILRWRPALNNYRLLQIFGQAVNKINGAGGGQVWGFIDGTFVAFCRPEVYDQKLAYSGHKHMHGQKFQAILTPDGIISSLVGPFRGPDNDLEMFYRSQIQDRIREVIQDRPMLYLFGDAGYEHEFGLWAPFQHANGWRSLEPEQLRFNRMFSKARIEVEHGFGLVNNLWLAHTYKRKQQSGNQLVSAHYMAAVLMTNLYTCYRGNQSSKRFGISPPSPEEYLYQGL